MEFWVETFKRNATEAYVDAASYADLALAEFDKRFPADSIPADQPAETPAPKPFSLVGIKPGTKLLRRDGKVVVYVGTSDVVPSAHVAQSSWGSRYSFHGNGRWTDDTETPLDIIGLAPEPLPDGIPPLPKGAVYLGRGGEFKVTYNPPHFEGWRNDLTYLPSEWNGSKCWSGDCKDSHYAAPANSEIAKMNGK